MPGQSAYIDAVADEMFALLGTSHQVAPFSARGAGIDLGAAYQLAVRISAIP